MQLPFLESRIEIEGEILETDPAIAFEEMFPDEQERFILSIAEAYAVGRVKLTPEKYARFRADMLQHVRNVEPS